MLVCERCKVRLEYRLLVLYQSLGCVELGLKLVNLLLFVVFEPCSVVSGEHTSASLLARFPTWDHGVDERRPAFAPHSHLVRLYMKPCCRSL
jgi:hypothetical protein